jgi:hypothetical protein
MALLESMVPRPVDVVAAATLLEAVDRKRGFQPILELYFFHLSSSTVFLFKIIKL